MLIFLLVTQILARPFSLSLFLYCFYSLPLRLLQSSCNQTECNLRKSTDSATRMRLQEQLFLFFYVSWLFPQFPSAYPTHCAHHSLSLCRYISLILNARWMDELNDERASCSYTFIWQRLCKFVSLYYLNFNEQDWSFAPKYFLTSATITPNGTQ